MNPAIKFPFLFSVTVLLASCSSAAGNTPTVPVVPTTAPTETATTASPSGITLTYGDNAQVELVTPTGRHVYIDIWNTSFLTKQPTADDVLLTTHMHPDHYDSAFAGSFPGQQIIMAMGDIRLPDVTVTTIASAHLPTDPISADSATDYIFVIETGGLRIVHFGDIGQEKLTDEQLATIGKVDLAVTQFSNSFSDMNAANRKGFNLMDQVKPRLIIPTHSDKNTIEIAIGLWTGYYSESRTVAIAAERMPGTTAILILGDPGLVSAYAKLYNLKEWK
jgi:L-ascorbate metabolism protein UlaG (beta-lactamase superfamily)